MVRIKKGIRRQKTNCRISEAGKLNELVAVRGIIRKLTESEAGSNPIGRKVAGKPKAFVFVSVQHVPRNLREKPTLGRFQVAVEDGFLNGNQSEVLQCVRILLPFSIVRNVVADKVARVGGTHASPFKPIAAVFFLSDNGAGELVSLTLHDVFKANAFPMMKHMFAQTVGNGSRDAVLERIVEEF